MTKRVGKKLYIKQESPDTCEYCGKVAELRPYGKGGARICYECGMKDIKTTEEMFERKLAGADTVVVVCGRDSDGKTNHL